MSKAAKRSSLTDHPNLRSALNTEQSLSLRLSFSHPLTFSLHLSPDVLPPRFQYAVLHLSFLRRFHLPSLYISLTHFPGVFALFFFKFLFFFYSTSPPPSLRCPSSSKAIILLPFSLYLHDSEVLSEAGADGQRKAFYKTVQV